MHSKSRQRGFTILELLIATTIFSVVLLIATTGIIRIGNIYYKGITASKTQETIRNISNELSSTIQFAGDIKTNGPNPANSFCLGDTRYTYYINSKYTKDLNLESSTGLYSESLTPGSACAMCSGACVLGSKQVLGNNMRLLSLIVNPIVGTANNVWQVRAKVAYGDNELLTHYTNNGALIAPPISPDTANCKSGIAGSSFCSTAELDTLVKRRLE
jgi:prepilin-type N-terminal cleavage/methylation domain-containing protein